MCTVVILRRPDHRWPLILGANRDEMRDRPWKAPARHWDDRPDVIAGLDMVAGGSWLGVNDDGVVATILDRPGTLGPLAGKRSRGELVLEALDHPDAIEAAGALAALQPQAYRPFHLLVADNRDAYWLCSDGARITRAPIEPGVSMLTSGRLNDTNDPRIRAFLPRFQDAHPPDPETDNWAAWESLLAAPAPAGASPHAGMSFQLDNGYGTGSAALIALPDFDHPAQSRAFRFCDGPPGTGQWRPVLY